MKRVQQISIRNGMTNNEFYMTPIRNQKIGHIKKITLLIGAILLTVYTNGQCNEPTNVHILNEWAELYILWDANGEDTWDIEYGETGFTPTGIPTNDDLINNYFVLYGVQPVSSYIDFYVRTDCGTEQSAWVGPFTFYNYCTEFIDQSYEVGISESFENGFLPYCWTEANQGTPNTGISEIGESTWEPSSFSNNPSNSLGAKINITGTDKNEWLILPAMQGVAWLKDVQYEYFLLNFDLALTQHNTTDAAILGSDDQVQLVLSTDLGQTWTNLKTWDSNSTISNTGEYVNIEYENWALYEQIFLVGFWASSGTVNDSENIDFFIDNLFALSPVTGEVGDLSSKGFSYYPNPSENTIQLSAKELINQVAIYNNLGQMLKEIPINALNKQIAISNLPSGIYFMQVTIGDTIGVVSVVKK